MLHGLDLFSGIGGISYALSKYITPIAYCEINKYCQKVLFSRMLSGTIPKANIWDDIKTFPAKEFKNKIEIIYGGFPCQDISIMGYGKGLGGKRSGLFFEIMRLAKEIKPDFIFLENVPAITYRGGLQVVTEIAEMGYDCRWCIISAASVGASHKRERWFLLAHSNGKSEHRLSSRKKTQQSKFKCHFECAKQFQWIENQSPLLRTDHGISYRVDRTKALGNAVVPAQAKKAFEILMGIS
jgi:DNA (cytosine-5)-methyltransferase 1